MSDDQLPDTWFSRDLPVLRAAAGHFENPDAFGLPTDENALAASTGLPVDQVLLALRALGPEYLDVRERQADGRHVHVWGMTPAAREVTGLWPTAESFTDRLLELLEATIDAAPDGEERSKLQALRDGFTRGGRDVAVGVIAGVLAAYIPR